MVARDVNGSPLNVGDKVLRVGSTTWPVVQGSFHIVREIVGGGHSIFLEGVDGPTLWIPEKFELVQEKQEKESDYEWWNKDLPAG
jgi:hypothetical protein